MFSMLNAFKNYVEWRNHLSTVTGFWNCDRSPHVASQAINYAREVGGHESIASEHYMLCGGIPVSLTGDNQYRKGRSLTEPLLVLNSGYTDSYFSLSTNVLKEGSVTVSFT